MGPFCRVRFSPALLGLVTASQRRPARVTLTGDCGPWHAIDPADTRHALGHRLASWPVDPDPPRHPDPRELVIGPGRAGQLLELIVIPADTEHRVTTP